MPRKATAAEMPTRKRDGGGRSKVYDIKLDDLRDIVGATDDKGEPEYLVFGPEDMASDTGDVAQLTTFTNQVRKWVEDYNDELGEDADTHYRALTKNFKLLDDDENQIRGTVKNGKVVPADPEADDFENYTELYESWIAIVPLTERDIRNRKARQKAHRERASSNGEADGENGGTEDESGSESTDQPAQKKETAKASK